MRNKLIIRLIFIVATLVFVFLMNSIIRRHAIRGVKYRQGSHRSSPGSLYKQGDLQYWCDEDQPDVKKQQASPRFPSVTDNKNKVHAVKPTNPPHRAGVPGNKAQAGKPSTIGPPVSPLNTSLLLYNKAPKCGSSSVSATFKAFMKYGRYLTNTEFEMNADLNNRGDRLAAILTQLSGASKLPLLFVKHFYFVDFTEYKKPPPVYIQMLRDPVDRFISQYQYQMDMQQINQTEWENSIEECLDNMDMCPELQGIIYRRSFLNYFCGAAHHTWLNSAEAVTLSKQNIERYYSVIGLTEEMDAFYEVLEHVHPNYFKGISAYHRCRAQASIGNKRVSQHRKEWPARGKKLLVEKKWADIEVYKFVQQRFHKQLEVARKHKQHRTAKIDCKQALKESKNFATKQEKFGKTVEDYLRK